MKQKYTYLLFLISLILLPFISKAQDSTTIKAPPLIQFSGVIVTGDSLQPVPFTNIIIKDTYRGTVSDYYGYFSFVARGGDTIQFSCVGYRKADFVIPSKLEDQRYSLIQLLNVDTIEIQETIVYPWPTREQFKKAFLNFNVPDDDLERARKNLTQADMKLRMESMPMDGSMNFKYQMQQNQAKLYYVGQAPPMNILNPIAWSKFISAWRNGDLKK